MLFLTFRAVLARRSEDREKLRAEGVSTVRRRAKENGMSNKGKERERGEEVQEESEVLKALLE